MLTETSKKIRTPDSPDYKQLEAIIQARGGTNTLPVFQTNATGLFETYVRNLPKSEQQHYTCRTCCKFFDNYANLVTINAQGIRESLFWSSVGIPAFFRKAVKALRERVTDSPIRGPFLPWEKVWGIPVTSDWTHFSVMTNSKYEHPLLTAEQRMAELREEMGMLQRALGNYPMAIAKAARVFLDSDTLFRNEKALAIAEWFVNVHIVKHNNDMLWYLISQAPPGFAHINTTMIGTLMDDIKAKLPATVIQENWRRKMSPTQYRRPTAAVTNQQVDRAEAVIAKMEAEGSLQRRFARLADIDAYIWRPVIQSQLSDGVFSHLRFSEKSQEIPSQKMTWTKFYKTILPHAKQISYLAKSAGPYYGLVAPVNRTCPPIIQWDSQVSWYFHTNGSSPRNWGLTANTFVPVKMIFNNPANWNRLQQHHKKIVFFALQGATDQVYRSGGLFFLSMLRAEYKPIEKVLEQYAVNGKIQGSGDANGVGWHDQETWDATFKIVTQEYTTLVTIDRFD